MTQPAVAGDSAPAKAATQDAVIAAVDNDTNFVDEGAAPESLSDAALAEILAGKGSETAGKKAEAAELEETVTDLTGKKKDDKVADPNMVTISKEEFEQLKKKVEHQELFIQRQGNEVGQLRKLKENLLNLAKAKREQANQQMLTDPTGALDTHAEAREAEQQAANVEAQEGIETNRAQIVQLFPDYEKQVDSIAEAALEMGLNPQFVENYRRNPYGTPVQTLVPYVRAAVLRNLYFQQAEEIKGLKAKVEELSNHSKTFPQKIRDAALKGPVVNANGGASTPATEFGNIEEDQISSLSYADLEKLLKTK